MVMGAHQDQVAQLGRVAIGPMPDVVALAVAGWAVATRERATAVAEVEGSAEWGGDEAALAAEVEGFALRAQDCGDEHAVAPHPFAQIAR